MLVLRWWSPFSSSAAQHRERFARNYSKTHFYHGVHHCHPSTWIGYESKQEHFYSRRREWVRRGHTPLSHKHAFLEGRPVSITAGAVCTPHFIKLFWYWHCDIQAWTFSALTHPYMGLGCHAKAGLQQPVWHRLIVTSTKKRKKSGENPFWCRAPKDCISVASLDGAN